MLVKGKNYHRSNENKQLSWQRYAVQLFLIDQDIFAATIFQANVERKYPYLYFTDAYFVSNNVGMATAEMVIETGFVPLILVIICIQYLKNANEPLSITLGKPKT